MPGSDSTTRVPFLRWLLAAVLLLFVAANASADILHYVQISDTRYYPDTLAEYYPDTPDTPLQRWITFAGNDTNSYYDDYSNDADAPPPIFGDTMGTGTVKAVFDYPMLEDVHSADSDKVTAFFEFNVLTLSGYADPNVSQTIQIGYTDLINDIEWDEAGQELLSTRLDGGYKVTNLPRLSDSGSLPLRIQMYYNFANYVATFVIINDATHTSTSFSWAATGSTLNPFKNYYGMIGGTDPDNREIYPYVFCSTACEVQALNWKVLDCNTVGGQVDPASCGPDLAITNNDGQATYLPGGSLTYVVTASNFSPYDVVGAMVSDAFPPALSCTWSCYQSGGASCTAHGSGDIAESVDLPGHASASFYATCSVDAGFTQPLVNVATIATTGREEDPLPANNTSTDTDIDVNDLIFDDGFESGLTTNLPSRGH